MSEWTSKRFWKQTTAQAVDGGHAVFLDGRPVKTPAKSDLLVPTPALATALVAEWDAQDDKVDPTTMPFTRMANSAIDKVGTQFSEVAEIVSAYGENDLVCYRAVSPQVLVDRQAAAWDPLLDWSAAEMGAPLRAVVGVMHEDQPQKSVEQLSLMVGRLSIFELTALHDLVAISGSLVIGLASLKQWEQPQDLWARSRVDEIWQAEQWGQDDEADAASAVRQAAFLNAELFFRMVENPT